MLDFLEKKPLPPCWMVHRRFFFSQKSAPAGTRTRLLDRFLAGTKPTVREVNGFKPCERPETLDFKSTIVLPTLAGINTRQELQQLVERTFHGTTGCTLTTL